MGGPGGRGEGKPFSKGFPLPFPRPPEAKKTRPAKQGASFDCFRWPGGYMTRQPSSVTKIWYSQRMPPQAGS